MYCPNCGGDCQIITDIQSTGKDFSAGKACCGVMLFKGPLGLLCGSCGKGKQIHSTHYWICSKCGNKFKA